MVIIIVSSIIRKDSLFIGVSLFLDCIGIGQQGMWTARGVDNKGLGQQGIRIARTMVAREFDSKQGVTSSDTIPYDNLQIRYDTRQDLAPIGHVRLRF